jgi:L-ascorbate metabolism protein UlaG (beta-lactamase superfamily)
VTRGRIGPLRRVEPVPSPDRLRGIDMILISHLHWDHLDVPSLRGVGMDVPIVVSTGAGAWLRGIGFTNVREVDAGDELAVGDVSVQAVQAFHSAFRPPAGPTAEPLGYMIRGGRSVYFAGDTDLFEDMSALARPGELIDVALLPVWGWGPVLGRGRHMDPKRAAESLRLIRPRAAVPIHWGTYWPHALGRVLPARLVEPPAAFAEYAAELAPKVRTLPTAVGDVVGWER